jgi:hypothetical protein
MPKSYRLQKTWLDRVCDDLVVLSTDSDTEVQVKKRLQGFDFCDLQVEHCRLSKDWKPPFATPNS